MTNKPTQSYRELRVSRLAFEEEEHAAVRDTYDHICRMLTKMIAHPETWCVSAGKTSHS